MKTTINLGSSEPVNLKEYNKKFPLTDSFNNPLYVFDRVIFNKSGALAFGEIVEIKSEWTRWGASWHIYLKCQIKIEVLMDNSESSNLKESKHISTVRNPNGIIKIENDELLDNLNLC